MKVVLHAGAYVTDEGKLIECLMKNRDVLLEHGVEVPKPDSYQQLIRDTLHMALQTGLPDDSRDVLLDAILKEDTPERLVLTNQRFFGTPKMAAYGGVLYKTAETRLGFYQKMFLGDKVELFMGLCNPATFLPGVLDQTRFKTMENFLGDKSPFDIRWSDLIHRMRAGAPNVGITLWCNEDTPLIWGRILREMAGLKPDVPLRGEYDLMQQIMPKEAFKRFEDYLANKPRLTPAQKHHVAATYLEKFALEDSLTHEIDIPGWSHEMVDRLTEIYDEDMAEIARIPNVRLIMP